MIIETTERAASLLGELARLVGLANRRWERERIYALHYDGGLWIHVTRRAWAFEGWEYVVPLDTRATEENLEAAVAAMRLELKEKEP